MILVFVSLFHVLLLCHSRLISQVMKQLIEINNAPLTVLFVIARCFVISRSLICNCPLLKDISFNTVFIGLVWLTLFVITLFIAILAINHPRRFWKIWNSLRFNRTYSKFSKMHWGNLSQIALPSMWLLVLIEWDKQTCRASSLGQIFLWKNPFVCGVFVLKCSWLL